MNDENLIPQSKRTKSEQRAIAVKGGVASGEARRRKANMRERLLEILEMPLKKGELKGFETLDSAGGVNMTVQDAVLLTAVKKALKGDMRAIDFLRDTSGNKLFGELPTTDNDARERLKETVQAISGAVNDDETH